MLYHQLVQFIEYMDIYVDVLLVYQELLLLQTSGVRVKAVHIREVVIKYSRGKKNRCLVCGIDQGEDFAISCGCFSSG